MICACVVSEFFLGVGRWLFVEPCCTSAVLLSMSFGINSVFTGLSFSKFNLFVWMKRKALACVHRSSNAAFIEKIERLTQSDARLRDRVAEYEQTVAEFQDAMTRGSGWWEWLRRSVSTFCAMAAFVFVAFECKTRMGAVLVLPYVFLLVAHLAWVFVITWRVKRSFSHLARAAKRKDTP